MQLTHHVQHACTVKRLFHAAEKTRVHGKRPPWRTISPAITSPSNWLHVRWHSRIRRRHRSLFPRSMSVERTGRLTMLGRYVRTRSSHRWSLSTISRTRYWTVYKDVWGFISSCIVTRCFFFFTWVLILCIILYSLCIYCLFLCFSSTFDAPHHLCSILHFRLLMDIYFLTVHGTSLLASDRYWIADSEAADFTGSGQYNFGWIVQPLEFIAHRKPKSGCHGNVP